MDLYKILGIGKDASKADIRKAYKAKAKETHPDAGGDAKAFQSVALAHRVLSDDGKRAAYDENGEIKDASETENEAALAIIGGLVDHLTNQIVQRDDLQFTDPLANMRRELDSQVKAAELSIAEAKRFETKATALRKRFKARKGPDYIGHMLDSKLEACRRAIKAGEERIVLLNKAKALLEDASFEVEMRPPSQPDQMGYGNDINAWRMGQARSGLFGNR